MTITDLERAAIAWWQAHRPRGWTPQEHIDHPDINTSTPTEHALAAAAAKAFERHITSWDGT